MKPLIDILIFKICNWRKKKRVLTNGETVSKDISHYQLNSVVPSLRYTRECVGCNMRRKGIRCSIDIFITIISCVENANRIVNNRRNNTSTLKGSRLNNLCEKDYTTLKFCNFE